MTDSEVMLKHPSYCWSCCPAAIPSVLDHYRNSNLRVIGRCVCCKPPMAFPSGDLSSACLSCNRDLIERKARKGSCRGPRDRHSTQPLVYDVEILLIDVNPNL